MDVNMVLGAFTGLMLSALLVLSRQDCARWVLAHVEGSENWSPPIAGFVTGTGIFIAAASLWLLGGGPH
jgi:hypothetical protein